MEEGMDEAFAGAEPFAVMGRQLHAGDPAPDFTLDYLDLADLAVRTICLADSSGSVRLLTVVNSLASPLCQQVIKQWETLRVRLPPEACLYSVSRDPPQVQARWQESEGVFSSSSREDLEEQLVRENAGLGSPSVTAAHFLQERIIRSSEMTGSTSGGGAGEYQERAPLAVSPTTGWNESSRALHTAGEERGMSSLESRRLERERGAGGDHDVPYRFALPASMPQVLAWMRLLAKVQQEGFGPQA
jgi:peroxiredoxin